MNRLFLFGQSHAWPLSSALARKLYVPGNGLEIECGPIGSKAWRNGFVPHGDGVRIVHPAFDKWLNEHRNGDARLWLLSVMDGQASNRVALLREGAPFDFVHPEGKDLAENAYFIPYDAVCSVVEKELKWLRAFLNALQQYPNVHIIHLEGPRPSDNTKAIWESRELFLRGKSAEHVSVNDPNLRLKLWFVQSLLTQEICKSTGATYMTPPEEALDERGFLRQDLMVDAIHGNHEFGRMTLNKIEKFIKSAGEHETKSI